MSAARPAVFVGVTAPDGSTLADLDAQLLYIELNAREKAVLSAIGDVINAAVALATAKELPPSVDAVRHARAAALAAERALVGARGAETEAWEEFERRGLWPQFVAPPKRDWTIEVEARRAEQAKRDAARERSRARTEHALLASGEESE